MAIKAIKRNNCIKEWKIVSALNYPRNSHYAQLKACSPLLTPERQPGSFRSRKWHERPNAGGRGH